MSLQFFSLVLYILLLLSSTSDGLMGVLHGIPPPSSSSSSTPAITELKSRSSSRTLLQDIHQQRRIVSGGLEEWNSKGAPNSNRNSGLVFSVIHRQHPSSPYRQAHKSHGDLMQEHVRRGLLRFESLQKYTAAERTSSTDSSGMPSKMNTVQENEKDEVVVAAAAGEWEGEYMVRMQLGTPARIILLIVDTGSGLTWVQCSPCTQCFVQQEPIFDPMGSKSYARVNCSHPACGSNSVFQCAESHNRTCEYGVQYGMTSFTTGVVSTDVLLIDSLSGNTSIRLDHFLFGCGLFNMGPMVGNSGLLGLSRSNISLPMQLASSGLNLTRKFSHCFADLAANRDATSFMYLGDSGPHQLKYTPFAVPPFRTQFYYVNLQAISVEGVLLPIPPSVFEFAPDGTGGTVIDSGTTVTLLVRPAYVLLRDAFRAAAASKHRLNATAIPGGFNSTVTGQTIDTCYQLGTSYWNSDGSESLESNSKANESLTDRKKKKPCEYRVPSVTLHFADQVDLPLPPNNVLFPFNDEGLFCLAFTGTMSEVGMNVIGNIQQQNFRIEYDLENSRIGFGRAHCEAET